LAQKVALHWISAFNMGIQFQKFLYGDNIDIVIQQEFRETSNNLQIFQGKRPPRTSAQLTLGL
jgi:hypothetical protein